MLCIVERIFTATMLMSSSLSVGTLSHSMDQILVLSDGGTYRSTEDPESVLGVRFSSMSPQIWER